MQPNYSYWRRLPHLQKDGHPLFVTFTTDRRWQLPAPARDAVLECCLQEHLHKFILHVAVGMPDHAHLIFKALRRPDGLLFPISEIMHSVKGASARRINRALARRGPVWQEEFFDHVPRSLKAWPLKWIMFAKIL
jgi:putative transposase